MSIKTFQKGRTVSMSELEQEWGTKFLSSSVQIHVLENGNGVVFDACQDTNATLSSSNDLTDEGSNKFCLLFN